MHKPDRCVEAKAALAHRQPRMPGSHRVTRRPLEPHVDGEEVNLVPWTHHLAGAAVGEREAPLGDLLLLVLDQPMLRTPVMIRFGEMTEDEVFISQDAARAGNEPR